MPVSYRLPIPSPASHTCTHCLLPSLYCPNLFKWLQQTTGKPVRIDPLLNTVLAPTFLLRKRPAFALAHRLVPLQAVALLTKRNIDSSGVGL